MHEFQEAKQCRELAMSAALKQKATSLPGIGHDDDEDDDCDQQHGKFVSAADDVEEQFMDSDDEAGDLDHEQEGGDDGNESSLTMMTCIKLPSLQIHMPWT